MRIVVLQHTCTMEPTAENQLPLDHFQVKKAVQALQAYLKSISSKTLLDETQQLCLLLTFWKIPKQEQTVRIPLPHALRNESVEVCLFTRDEPNMTADQTERFYKKLLTQSGVKFMPQVIPFKVLKTEYKPYEAKRKLLSNFDIFLADARIRRRLPSHIGKHFYLRKKAPLSVNLMSKHMARDLDRLVQGTTLTVNKKGSCCLVRVAHSGMTTDQIVENIVTAVGTISTKLRLKGKGIKIIHLKSHTSVALPIYTSDLSHLTLLEEELKKAKLAKATKQKQSKSASKDSRGDTKDATAETDVQSDGGGDERKDEEEIPQLVPIESPSKKPKKEESEDAQPSPWAYYQNKPHHSWLFLCTGIVLYLLTEFEVTDVPDGMGPVCLSVGIVFSVVALVLLPILKD
ncbi:Ribosomal L1 domain-containing protein 1 [Bagarius yarrelli]|uniref:Ribosomal L1 domain-containing protein 1 n=1 Tax=Bagarius yarrelli TaxID=175774 RepID=A0A556TIV4_BAGYA|nr:Ribosomal L1 domain-containing protein 1 [Bagarius yarrelli]